MKKRKEEGGGNGQGGGEGGGGPCDGSDKGSCVKEGSCGVFVFYFWAHGHGWRTGCGERE